MAKLNVYFNGTKYVIDEGFVADAKESLVSVLTDLANRTPPAAGIYRSGAIDLYYSGQVEEAEKMLETSWDELVAMGYVVVENGEVKAGIILPELPQKNSYGFYFNVMYHYEGNGYIFHSNGAIDKYTSYELVESYPAGTAKYSANTIDASDTGERAFSVERDGLSIVNRENGYQLDQKAPLVGDLILPNSDDIFSIARDGFYNHYDLTGILMPNNIINIGNWAFGRTGLTSIRIPDSVNEIGSGVFQQCSNLKSAIIGNGLTYISTDLFQSCVSLTDITFGKHVTSIDDGAFWNCGSFKSFEIPEGVTSIGDNAFRGCDFTSVTLPSSLLTIGMSFYYCTDLNNINYNGTIAQWNLINKNSYWISNAKATHVHCIDGDVAI